VWRAGRGISYADSRGAGQDDEARTMPKTLIAAVKWGAIVGVVVYLALMACNALSNVLLAQTGANASVTEHPQLLLPLCLSLFVLVFAFSAAGFYTGRETGRAEFGALAGMVALIVQYVLGLIGDALTSIGSTSSSVTTPQQNVSPVIHLLLLLVAAGLDLALAGSIGWLGGRPGAARSARRKMEVAPVASTASGPTEQHEG
jgi:hypothetical protein